MITLYRAVTGHLVYQRDKHGLDEDFVETTINRMTNYDFLVALSDGIDKREGMSG